MVYDEAIAYRVSLINPTKYGTGAALLNNADSAKVTEDIASRWQSPDIQAPWITSKTPAPSRDAMQGNGTIPSLDSMP